PPGSRQPRVAFTQRRSTLGVRRAHVWRAPEDFSKFPVGIVMKGVVGGGVAERGLYSLYRFFQVQGEVRHPTFHGLDRPIEGSAHGVVVLDYLRPTTT